jgi:hypothetical protein
MEASLSKEISSGEIGFQALDSVPDARRNSRSAQLAAVLIAHCPEHSLRQRTGQRLEVQGPIRTLLLGLFHQEPAQRLDTLINGKEMMPRLS